MDLRSQDVQWEAFLTTGDSTVYGTDVDLEPIRVANSACCAPIEKLEPAKACCGSAGEQAQT